MARAIAASKAQKRLIIVSNRLPVSLVRENGKLEMRPSSGGLVTALGPVLKGRGGVWVGWPGLHDADVTEVTAALDVKQSGYTLVPVMLSREDEERFYFGFSNRIVWPLFHEIPFLYDYDPDFWEAYLSANRRFAEVVAALAGEDDYIWVHDYHLMNLGQALRKLGVTASIGFFLHTPFPAPDIFKKLPWRKQVLEALLEYDLLGFQTLRHRRNFLQGVRRLLPEKEVRGRGTMNLIEHDGREVRVGSFPISIDYESFAGQASSPEVTDLALQYRQSLSERCIVLGIDRLDYTKGIPYKLRAFGLALSHHPDLRRRITFVQVVVPSRESIPQYHELKMTIERLVGEINGAYTEPGWVPVHYLFRSLKRAELLAMYRAADVALITPVEDGMNLVAKEYCACDIDATGTLILSEFAGAAAQLQRGALLVNPCDLKQMEEAIYAAYTMEVVEKRARMRRLQRTIREQDVYWWVDSFLRAGADADLGQYPTLEDVAIGHEDDLWSGEG